MAIPVTDMLMVLPGDFGDAGFGSQPFQTYAGLRIPITPASADAAFATARDALHANGGAIWVAPGTATYDFTQRVDWGTKAVEIRWSPGATASYSGSADGLFTFKRPARVIGLRVQQDVGNSPSGQSILLVDDTAAANVATDCEFIGCTFSLKATANAVRDLMCIRARGFSAVDQTGGLVVSRCSMILRSGGTQGLWSWVGEETSGAGTNEITGVPYGIGFVHVKNFRHAHLRSLSVRGQAQGGSGQYAGLLALLEDSLYCDVQGLTVSDVTLDSVNSQGTGLAVRGVSSEGGHMHIRSGSWSRVTAGTIIGSSAPQWLAMSGVVGRTLPKLKQFVRSINGGNTGLLRGNLLSNAGDGTTPGLFCNLDALKSAVVTGNLVTERQDNAYPFALPSCRNVDLRDNLVVSKD